MSWITTLYNKVDRGSTKSAALASVNERGGAFVAGWRIPGRPDVEAAIALGMRGAFVGGDRDGERETRRTRSGVTLR